MSWPSCHVNVMTIMSIMHILHRKRNISEFSSRTYTHFAFIVLDTHFIRQFWWGKFWHKNSAALWHHITSNHIASHHITSPYTTWRDVMSCHITSPQDSGSGRQWFPGLQGEHDGHGLGKRQDPGGQAQVGLQDVGFTRDHFPWMPQRFLDFPPAMTWTRVGP